MTPFKKNDALLPRLVFTSSPYVFVLVLSAHPLSTYSVKHCITAITTSNDIPPTRPAHLNAKGKLSIPAPTALLINRDIDCVLEDRGSYSSIILVYDGSVPPCRTVSSSMP